jgi:hypothetical protein
VHSTDRAKRLAAPVLAALLLAGPAAAEGQPSTGQNVFVPLFSEVPFGDRGGRLLVRSTVVVRNLDPDDPLTIELAEYRDSGGKKVKLLADQPIRVAPLASHRFDVKESDTSGGTTPSMLVVWKAETPIDPPLVEGLMVSTLQNLGLAVRTEGKVLTPPEPSR